MAQKGSKSFDKLKIKCILSFFKIILAFPEIFSSLFFLLFPDFSKSKEKKEIAKLKNRLQRKDKQISQIKLEKSRVEKISQQLVTNLLAENQKLRKKKCQGCKTVYLYMTADELSFSENLDKHSLPDENSDEWKLIYYLEDKYIFINFRPEENNGKCYLINFYNGSIYLLLDEWRNSEEDELLVYRKLCLNREIHIDNTKEFIDLKAVFKELSCKNYETK